MNQNVTTGEPMHFVCMIHNPSIHPSFDRGDCFTLKQSHGGPYKRALPFQGRVPFGKHFCNKTVCLSPGLIQGLGGNPSMRIHDCHVLLRRISFEV